MADLSTSDVVAIIGWPVTFALGMAATLLAQKFSRSEERRVGEEGKSRGVRDR